jgi:S1-C subfamily serine protease
MVLILLLGGIFYLYKATEYQYEVLQIEMSELKNELESLRKEKSSDITKLTKTQCEFFETIKPSVVQIVNKKRSFEGMEYYSSGSGFVYDRKGHIITNNHVIDGADLLEVTFLDGSFYKAELIGADVYSDLAVLKVDLPSEKLYPAIIGNSSESCVGERVYAVGNPFGLSGSMSEGIISQFDRTLRAAGGFMIVGVIQVDAAINPGNSGGPLLNTRGEVIGVNTAIQSETGTFSGIGFAIPSNLVRKVIPSVITTGEYKHPWLGILGMDLSVDLAEIMDLDIKRGFLIIDVIENSPAEKAGLQGGNKTITIEDGREIKIGGDVVIGIDDINVSRMEDMLIYLEYNTSPSDKIVMQIIRNGAIRNIEVTLGERPSISELS